MDIVDNHSILNYNNIAAADTLLTSPSEGDRNFIRI